MATAKKKVIPSPVDVVGRKVSWSPANNSDRLYGEVIKVYFKMGADPRYPKGSQGYKNGIRALFQKMSIILADGRVLNISSEMEDLKAIGMIAESSSDE
jgi:hypothetical protein